jgi:hypothetical protein
MLLVVAKDNARLPTPRRREHLTVGWIRLLLSPDRKTVGVRRDVWRRLRLRALQLQRDLDAFLRAAHGGRSGRDRSFLNRNTTGCREHQGASREKRSDHGVHAQRPFFRNTLDWPTGMGCSRTPQTVPANMWRATDTCDVHAPNIGSPRATSMRRKFTSPNYGARLGQATSGLFTTLVNGAGVAAANSATTLLACELASIAATGDS